MLFALAATWLLQFTVVAGLWPLVIHIHMVNSYWNRLYLICHLNASSCHSHHTHTHPFNGPLSGTTWVSRYQKGKTNLDFTEARDSGISWTICKSALRSRQISTPVPHHSVFYRPDALPATQPTASKHWRHSFNIFNMLCWISANSWLVTIWCEPVLPPLNSGV